MLSCLVAADLFDLIVLDVLDALDILGHRCRRERCPMRALAGFKLLQFGQRDPVGRLCLDNLTAPTFGRAQSFDQLSRSLLGGLQLFVQGSALGGVLGPLPLCPIGLFVGFDTLDEQLGGPLLFGRYSLDRRMDSEGALFFGSISLGHDDDRTKLRNTAGMSGRWAKMVDPEHVAIGIRHH